MNTVIVKIGFRNLIRQKRRNMLLGIGIAFGTCILIIANAFSHGLSDVLLNKILTRIAGHIVVNISEKDRAANAPKRQIIRDRARIEQIIRANVENIQSVEQGVATFARAIGKGGSEFLVVIGLDDIKTFQKEVEVASGALEDMTNPNMQNPIAMTEDMAEFLNVTLHDAVKARFQTVYGQSQSAQFTIVAVLKSFGNPFMNMASFVDLKTLKPLLGFQQYETGSFSIILKDLDDPEIATIQADKLHKALQAELVGYVGAMHAGTRQKAVSVFAAGATADALNGFAKQFELAAGTAETLMRDRDAALISQPLAEELGVTVGSEIALNYETKFGEPAETQTLRVGAIFKPTAALTPDMAFAHPEQMFDTAFQTLPKTAPTLAADHALRPFLMNEWTLLDRSRDLDAFQKKYRELKKTGWWGRILDVQTMRELASDILKLEWVLDIVTWVAGLILFFIILIGVVNTLRMTIRERTREIGTVRAIGMQQADVLWSFVSEVLMLTIFSSLAGVVFAFIGMELLKLITFDSKESFFMIFLVNKHVHFVATFRDIAVNLAIIFLIALGTSVIPAYRAARMSVAGALRHYE